MARIHSPNKKYDGVTASVKFNKGVGETSTPYLIEWFKKNGYTVEEVKEAKKSAKDDKKESAKVPSEADTKLESPGESPDDVLNDAESAKVPGE